MKQISKVKYPEIVVSLIGHNGNAFAIMVAVRKELKKNNISQSEIDQYFKEAMSGDYDNLLQVTAQWVNIQ